MNTFDVTVIGAGPGGITASLEARRMGFKTCLVEASRLGGTCLQVGCIPSKTFLHAAALINEIKNASNWGIQNRFDGFNPEVLIQKKQNVITLLEKGIKTQLDKAKVTVMNGKARFVSRSEIQVGSDTVKSKYFILATGSRPRVLAELPFDGSQIISSTEALELKRVPEKFLILGGGVIGVEFASMYCAFGSKVVMVEMLERLIATEDPEISKRLEVSFKKRGVEIYLGDSIVSLEKRGSRLIIKLKSGTQLEVDQILVAIGRSRNIEDLDLETAGVRVDEGGAVEVNQFLETTQSGIFAIGDLIRAPQLAHAASFEADVVIRNLKVKNHSIDLSLIPNAIYTHPEIASLGMTLETAKSEGYPDARESKLLLGALGRSHTEGAEEGIAKLVFDEVTGQILGAHLFGAHVTELISEIALAIKFKLKIKDLLDIVHPHPTLSEMFQELARQVS